MEGGHRWREGDVGMKWRGQEYYCASVLISKEAELI